MLRIWLHIGQAIVWGIHILFHSDVSERHIKAPRGLLLLNIGLSLLNLPVCLRIIQIRFAIHHGRAHHAAHKNKRLDHPRRCLIQANSGVQRPCSDNCACNRSKCRPGWKIRHKQHSINPCQRAKQIDPAEQHPLALFPLASGPKKCSRARHTA